jgi:hypothetical protein
MQYCATDRFNKTSFQPSASQYAVLHEGLVLWESLFIINHLSAAVLFVHYTDYWDAN